MDYRLLSDPLPDSYFDPALQMFLAEHFPFPFSGIWLPP